MAIYIPILKQSEDDERMVFSYGEDPPIGDGVFSKATGELEKFSCSRPEKEDFYRARVERVLKRNHAAGRYPERSSYCA